MSSIEIAAEAVGKAVLKFKESSERLKRLEDRSSRFCKDLKAAADILCPKVTATNLPVPANLPTSSEIRELLSEIRQANIDIRYAQDELKRMGLPCKF